MPEIVTSKMEGGDWPGGYIVAGVGGRVEVAVELGYCYEEEIRSKTVRRQYYRASIQGSQVGIAALVKHGFVVGLRFYA